MLEKISKILFLFSLYFNSALIAEQPSENQLIMEALLANSQPKIFLLSALRSGNTWMRYCIEVLTERPTAEFMFKIRPDALPFGLICDHPIDMAKAPVWKAHILDDLNCLGRRPYNNKEDHLILLIRNPKETIIRETGSAALGALTSGEGRKNFQRYFENLAIYDEWQGKKYLIYYEDFMTNPRRILEKIVDFLGDSQEKFDDFFAHYQEHKIKSIKLYADYFYTQSITKGEDLLAHSRKLSRDHRNELDVWIDKNYRHLWQKYLKEKFSEDALHNKY